MPITTADISSDLMSEDPDDLNTEGATLSEDEKQAQYQKSLQTGGDDNLTVKEREKRRLDLH